MITLMNFIISSRIVGTVSESIRISVALEIWAIETAGNPLDASTILSPWPASESAANNSLVTKLRMPLSL